MDRGLLKGLNLRYITLIQSLLFFRDSFEVLLAHFDEQVKHERRVPMRELFYLTQVMLDLLLALEERVEIIITTINA